MRISAGKAELRAFAERVQARYEAEVSAQPAHLLRGVLCLACFPDTPACAMTLLNAFAIGTAMANCLCGSDGDAVSACQQVCCVARCW